VAGLPCLVVGAGPVGARRAEALVEAGAAVTVVAPELSSAVVSLEEACRGVLRVQRRPYRAGEASGYRLVVAATGVRAVDAQVTRDALTAGTWVNQASSDATPDVFSDAAAAAADASGVAGPRGGGGTYAVPAVHRDGSVMVAVSSAGTSPALSSWLRDRLAAAVGEGLGTLAGLLAEARERCIAIGRDTSSVDWRALLDGPLPGLVADGRIDEAWELLRRASG
jgi:precorrin-2 dehydrogenase